MHRDRYAERSSSGTRQAHAAEPRSRRTDYQEQAFQPAPRRSRHDASASREAAHFPTHGSSMQSSMHHSAETKSRSVNSHRRSDESHSATRSGSYIGCSRYATSDRRHPSATARVLYPENGQTARGNRRHPSVPTRSGYADVERERAARHQCRSKDNQLSRPQPGEELPSYTHNSWMDIPDEPVPTNVPLSRRTNSKHAMMHSADRRSHRQEVRQDGRDEMQMRSSSRKAAGLERASSKGLHRTNPDMLPPRHDKDSIKARRHVSFGIGPHPWAMGSSVATSAQGSNLDSPDLWETSSVDSLPLGAEWFNFMHGRK